jgi:hypothetical protein
VKSSGELGLVRHSGESRNPGQCEDLDPGLLLAGVTGFSLATRPLPLFRYLTISKYILIACPPRGAASLAPKPPG